MCKEKVTEMFGSMVFNENVMKQRLSTTCYKAWKNAWTRVRPSPWRPPTKWRRK